MTKAPSTEMDWPSYIACGTARKLQNRSCDFLGTPNTSHRNALLHSLKRLPLTACNHLVGHRRPDHPGHTALMRMPACSVFKDRALREPNHSVLRGMIDSTLRTAHAPTKRGAIDDGAVDLFAYLLQLKLHATPY